MLPKLFKHVYIPDIEIFHYKKTREQILSKLQEIFAQRSEMWSGPGITGSVLTDTEFYIKMSAPKLGSDKITPVMYCLIHENPNGECTIETKAYAGLRLKVNLYIFLILGCILVITGYSNNSFELSLVGVFLMILAVIVINWIAYIMKGVVQDRYFRCIHSQLN